jgi:hypothetical protein
MTVGLTRDDDASSVVQGPGQRIGPYRLIQPLGEGGMGVVHLALDPYGRAVAVKVLREHIAHDRDARDRLKREVATLALVQDDRVAAVLDADTEGPRPYIVTRYIPGPALDKVVSEHGPLQGEALLRLGRGLWVALNAIHAAGVIHRDLKPANVVLLDGDPVVIDFGIAHVADDIRLTMTGLVMGTPGYLSPEVVEGAPVTEATDWWGWAATLAFAASGAPPFGRGPMDVVLDRVRRGQADLSGVDQRLAPLLEAALSPTPTERPQAHEVVQALDLYAAGAPPTIAIPVASPTQVQEWRWDGQPDPVGEQGAEADRDDGSGQADPEAGWPSRSGTLFAMLVGVLGVATIWPIVAVGMLILWSWAARFADRSVTSLMRRRTDNGWRRSDIPMAVIASPWHVVVAFLAMVVTALIPAIVAIGSTFAIALAASAVSGGPAQPDRAVPVVAGGFLGLVMGWWGPGGASLQRGSRSLVRALASGRGATDFFVATFVLMGVGIAAWAWVRNGQLEWWPWSLADIQAISGSVW